MKLNCWMHKPASPSEGFCDLSWGFDPAFDSLCFEGNIWKCTCFQYFHMCTCNLIIVNINSYFAFRYIGEIISDCEADHREDDSYLFDLDNRVSNLQFHFYIDMDAYWYIASHLLTWFSKCTPVLSLSREMTEWCQVGHAHQTVCKVIIHCVILKGLLVECMEWTRKLMYGSCLSTLFILKTTEWLYFGISGLH